MEDPWFVLKNGEKKSVSSIETLEFTDPIFIKEIQKRTTRVLKGSFRRKMNLFSCALFENEFTEKKTPKYSIRFVDSLIGYGVYAEQTIPKLAYIGEYVGVVRRRDKKRDQDNSYIFRYLRTNLFKPLVIDAEEKGNFTRFINHSDEPNLTSRWIIVDGIYHVILFANQMIPKGKQLTYDYGPNYWSKRPDPLCL